MSEALQFTGWLFFSALKFLFAPGSIYVVGGYSFWQTIFISVLGGWMGVLGFFYFGKIIFGFFSWLSGRLSTGAKKPKRKMTRMNRFIVQIKNHRLGVVGLALITPSVFSIPLGCILAAKYFGHDKRALPFLMGSVILWAFVLTSLVSYFDFRF